ncbi:hypothetical protein CPB86DRAFT_783682 [Serendipita vermifera]|nr:hypothetical protein CPB86DRAFT_783682 [Serendipita vermifera]
MGSSINLPIEIWEHILKHVIFNTLLLSTAPLDYPWRFTEVVYDWVWLMDIVFVCGTEELRSKGMKEFQQTRNQLRLVCRSWKRYADSPRIDTLSIQVFTFGNGNPPINRILSARRLEVVHRRNGPVPKIEGALAQMLMEKKTFSTSLLIDQEGVVTYNILRNHPHLFPCLTALHIDISNGISTALDLKSTLPRLTCLTCLSIYFPHTFIFTEGMFDLPNLTTLSLHFHHHLSNLHVHTWYLPSLRHLRLLGILMMFLEDDPIESVFAISPQLQTLSLVPHDQPPSSFPISLNPLWIQCPRIARIQAPLSSIWFSEIPLGQSLTHLVHLDPVPLADYIPVFAKAKSNKSLQALIVEIISPARGLHTITDSHSWSKLAPNSPVHVVARELGALGIRYEDLGGRTREEYQKEFHSRQVVQRNAFSAINGVYLWAVAEQFWASFRRIISFRDS